MKNLQTYEQFLFEESPTFGFDGSQLQVGKSVISFDGFSGIIVSKESVNGRVQYRDHKGVIRVCESRELIETEAINEDLQWWEVTKGILAADAIQMGAGLAGIIAGGGIIAAAHLFGNWRKSISNKIDKIRKEAKYEWLKTEASKIAGKFNGDAELNSLLAELQKYPYTDTTFIKGVKAKKLAKETNESRNKLMREISKYVKSKLAPEEMEFFVEINKMLRDKPLIDETGSKIEEDVVSDPNRTVGTGTLTATSSDANSMAKGAYQSTDPTSAGTIPTYM